MPTTQTTNGINGSFSIKTWLAIAVPIGAFLVGVYGVGVWKGDVSTRLSAVESDVIKNEKATKVNEQIHRDEMWKVRVYLHSLDKNMLVMATKMKIKKDELSDLNLEMPKRAELSN